ncbi:hypothetical protein EKK97_09730 [Billgrantia tianxiuensis]|jgi:septal ring factor EnvC (AmiA/AmiB activator)|uniref:Type III secretion protein n=1 Tax=Billgrantia tianxiuensis TaxID=2497861 RepID=A0A6I6SGP3_9GAMM|nr:MULTISPECIES: hypothetical protein [Halomonas]MCE8032143.1 hypothetical protein [Halomonas sp. MCCC 1A11057]QHC49828.1 hypothetical protein EKK97_09730 [Halomonas tianxiuensis]
MRQRNHPFDEPCSSDAESQRLRSSLAQLVPIRAHRQLMAERRWRRARQTLAELQEKLRDRETECEQRRQLNQQRRGELADDHQSRSIDHASLKAWMEEEQRLRHAIATLEHDLNRLKQALEEQERHVVEAKRDVEQQQRDSERLSLLMQRLEEEA